MNDVSHSGDQMQRFPLNHERRDSDVIHDKAVAFLRRKPCIISRTHIVFLAAVFVLVIFISILTTVFVMKSKSDTSCFPETTNTIATTTVQSVAVVQNTTPDPPCMVHFRLPKALNPISYDLTLKVDLDKFMFSGSVEIKVSVKYPTDCIIVNVNNLTINATKITVINFHDQFGTIITVESAKEYKDYQLYIVKLRQLLKVNASYTIQFGWFSGPIQRDFRGLYLSSYEASDGKTRYLATSQLQSTDARKVFPCFDEPQLKAIFKVSIIHRKGYTALSNRQLLKPDDGPKKLANGWWKTEFAETPLMSSYLLAFVVSDFAYKETTVDGLRIRLWSQPATLEQTTFALTYCAKTYKYFADYFGMPEVMTKADHVAVPDFSAGAMENWGLVIYRETSVLYDANVSASVNKYMIALIVAHEIVHTWFGNIVTMKWWTDLWLNEGFASTLMFFAMDHVFPDWKVYDMQVAEDIFPVMVQDALDTSHPVSTPINHPSEIIQYFDAISYQKGMAVLRMLRNFLGWDDFRLGLQNYIKRYKFDNAEMSELWTVFTETVDGRFDVAKIMDTWTRQMGYPVVTVTADGDVYHLAQDRFRLNSGAPANGSDSKFGYKWYIPFTYRTQYDDKTQIMWLNMTSASIPKPKSEGWILGNVDIYGYYLVNYEDSMWQKLAAQLNTNHLVFSQSNRAGLINNALSLARAGRLQYNLALNMTTFLKKETKFVPWKAFDESMKFLKGMLSTTPVYGWLQVYIKKLVSPLFDRVQLDRVDGSLPERYMDKTLLEYGCFVRLEKATKMAQKMFQDWMLHGIRIPADFAQTVYSVGIREGGEYEWDFLWNKSLETNVATEMEMMRDALTHTQRDWLLWKYSNWIFDESKIRLQDVRHVINAMSNNPMSRMIIRNFLMNNWQRLLELYKNDWYGLKDIIPLFTKYVNTDFEHNQLQQLFEQHPPKAASESANSALALIRANIRWMEKSYPAIEEWLRTHAHTTY